MLGLSGSDVHQSGQGWLPVVYSGGLRVMSIGFLLKSKNDAVIWRGPKKHAMIKQFLVDVVWGELDYLIVDTPPGTSDEHMSIMEVLGGQGVGMATERKLRGVLVTTPNLVSVGDVRREVTFCQKTGLQVIGIIENMSGFHCPCCQDRSEIFGVGGGEMLSVETGLSLLGRIGIDPELVKAGEEGVNFLDKFSASPVAKEFESIVASIVGNAIVEKMDVEMV